MEEQEKLLDESLSVVKVQVIALLLHITLQESDIYLVYIKLM